MENATSPQPLGSWENIIRKTRRLTKVEKVPHIRGYVIANCRAEAS